MVVGTGLKKSSDITQFLPQILPFGPKLSSSWEETKLRRFVESLAITSSISCSQAPDERSELLMSCLGFSLILSLSLSL